MNAGIVTQGDVRRFREEDLSNKTQAHSINVAGDFTGFADHFTADDGRVVIDWDGLADSFIDHVKMTSKRNMSLKPSKTFFGSPKCDFFGHELDKDGWRSADHKLAPIGRCIAPSDIHELRRVMGLFVQHKDAIPWYSTEAARRCTV